MNKWWLIPAMFLVPLASGYYAWQAMARQHQLDSPVVKLAAETTEPVNLAWPAAGRAAVGLAETGECRTFGSEEAFPTASIAKVITALVVLDEHPLDGSRGDPTLTMTDADMARLATTISEGGSFMEVEKGETLTQKQVLQAVMLRSANNLADSLAIWAFGSLENYREKADIWLKKNNLDNTTIGSDASGLDAGTTATAGDLCRLMMIALKNPTLSEIMSTSETDFPVVGSVQNTNRLLNQQGVFAGKTGFTNEAGAGMILATRVTVGDKEQIVVVAMLGQENYDVAFAAASQLIDSLGANLVERIVAKPGQKVGYLTSAWSQPTDLTVDDELSVVTWADQPPDYLVGFDSTLQAPVSDGQQVGIIRVDDQATNIVADNSLTTPSFWWRLAHGF